MEKRQKIKNFLIVFVIAILIILIFNYVLRVDIEVLGIVGAVLVAMMPSVLSFLTSNKTNEIIKRLVDDMGKVRTELKDVGEVIHHKKDMTKLSQQIENETSDIFDSLADINVMLRDYIIDVNDVITDTITKQYQYDFDQFDAKYFKTKIINKITRLNADIDYVMINEHCFEQISDKVLDNVRKYITELKYIKDLENGKRRSEFKELTLSLTKKITYHSIDIFKNFKQTA
jgi:hypothetical protein